MEIEGKKKEWEETSFSKKKEEAPDSVGHARAASKIAKAPPHPPMRERRGKSPPEIYYSYVVLVPSPKRSAPRTVLCLQGSDGSGRQIQTVYPERDIPERCIRNAVSGTLYLERRIRNVVSGRHIQTPTRAAYPSGISRKEIFSYIDPLSKRFRLLQRDRIAKSASDRTSCNE